MTLAAVFETFKFVGWACPPLFTHGVDDGFKIGRHHFIAIANTMPTLVVLSISDPAMKTGIWPVMRTSSPTMLDGIVMDVIKMSLKIIPISNGMLPESPLPITTFAMFDFGKRHLRPVFSQHTLREQDLHSRNPQGKIPITFWKLP